jgi:hypothetical protein
MIILSKFQWDFLLFIITYDKILSLPKLISKKCDSDLVEEGKLMGEFAGEMLWLIRSGGLALSSDRKCSHFL